MGGTTGSLKGIEQKVITIKIPPAMTREQADEFAAALNQLVSEFNAAHPPGAPRIVVT